MFFKILQQDPSGPEGKQRAKPQRERRGRLPGFPRKTGFLPKNADFLGSQEKWTLGGILAVCPGFPGERDPAAPRSRRHIKAYEGGPKWRKIVKNRCFSVVQSSIAQNRGFSAIFRKSTLLSAFDVLPPWWLKMSKNRTFWPTFTLIFRLRTSQILEKYNFSKSDYRHCKLMTSILITY